MHSEICFTGLSPVVNNNKNITIAKHNAKLKWWSQFKWNSRIHNLSCQHKTFSQISFCGSYTQGIFFVTACSITVSEVLQFDYSLVGLIAIVPKIKAYLHVCHWLMLESAVCPRATDGFVRQHVCKANLINFYASVNKRHSENSCFLLRTSHDHVLNQLSFIFYILQSNEPNETQMANSVDDINGKTTQLASLPSYWFCEIQNRDNLSLDRALISANSALVRNDSVYSGCVFAVSYYISHA